MVADLYKQLTLHDEVELLTVVRGQLDLLLLSLGVELALDVQRLGYTVLEGVREVVVGHAVSLRYLLTRSLSGNGVGFQVRGDALDDIGNVNVERLSTAVDEREVQILKTRLARLILSLSDVGIRRHLGNGLALQFAKLADTGRHLPYLDV